MDLREFEELERRAQAGSFRAMRRLGEIYKKGGTIGALWIPKDEEKARRFQEAARKGRSEVLRRALNPSLFRENVSVGIRSLPDPRHILRSLGSELLDDILRPLGRVLLLTVAVCVAIAIFAALVAFVSDGAPRILVAVAHTVGAVLSAVAFWFFLLFLSSWQLERRKKQFGEEAALALGVPPEHLDREHLGPALFRIYAERFSSELLRNRLSDLCGLVLTIWDWLGAALQLGAVVGVIWFMIAEGAENAAGAWFIVGVAVFFWLVGLVFTQLCRLITGRYPGEAKQGRKILVEFNKKMLSSQ